MIFRLTVRRFFSISGSDHAAAFAFYAFFSFFPLLLLMVSIGSIFVDDEAAARGIIEGLQPYLPIGEEHRQEIRAMMDKAVAAGVEQMVASVVGGVDRYRWMARILGFVALTWASLRFFKALVHMQNVAWGRDDVPWWNMPVKSAMLFATVASALVLGVLAPAVVDLIARFLPTDMPLKDTLSALGKNLISVLILFYGLFVFYRFGPQNRVASRDVWLPALLATLGLSLSRNLLVYAIDSTVNQLSVVYDAFAVVIAVLYGVYLAGMVVVFCGCLGPILAKVRSHDPSQTEESEI